MGLVTLLLQPIHDFADMGAVARFAHDVEIGALAAMPAVSSVIAGATRPEQVLANVKAGEWVPSADDLAALKALR